MAEIKEAWILGGRETVYLEWECPNGQWATTDMEVTPRVMEKTHQDVLSSCTTAYQEGHDCKSSPVYNGSLSFSPPCLLEIFQLHPQSQHHFLLVFGPFPHALLHVYALTLKPLLNSLPGHAEQKAQQHPISSSITSNHLSYKCSWLLQNLRWPPLFISVDAAPKDPSSVTPRSNSVLWQTWVPPPLTSTLQTLQCCSNGLRPSPGHVFL